VPQDNQDKVEIKVSRASRLSGSAQNLMSISTLRKLPSNLTLIRKFMAITRWDDLHREIQGELERKVAIVGLPNVGKSTLFNTLQGRSLSAVSDVAGTTTSLVRGAFGPFLLIDTPGHLPDMQREAVDEASAMILLLDASRSLRQEERTLLRELRRTQKPLVVALNKVDALRADPDDVAGELAARLGVEDVIPVAARTGWNVGEELVPALLEASPEAAITIGMALPAFRREAASRIVRNATLVALAAGLEPIPLIDIPILLGNQIRLVLRLAALYGEPMSAKHSRELAGTILAGLAMRYIAEEMAKMVPIGGDVVSGAIAAAATWGIGQVAIEYFENGKRFSRAQLQSIFQRYYRQYREQQLERQLGQAEAQVAVPPAAPAMAPVVAPPAAGDGAAPPEATAQETQARERAG
jgi:small GTP-binding protein